MTSTNFPKHENIFSEDIKTMNMVKTIEDRIEQKYQALDIQTSLIAINEIIGDRPIPNPNKKIKLDPESLIALEELTKDSPPPSQLDIDRNHILEMIRRSGKLYVLGLTSPRLMLSFENLFSGLVVNYIKMFASSENRSQLDQNQAFRNNEEAKIVHEKLKALRNKQYAHKELENGRHTLHYIIKDEKISIDSNAPHHTFEFHRELLAGMIKCVHSLIEFIENDIEKKWEKLFDGLTEKQKSTLLQVGCSGKTTTQSC